MGEAMGERERREREGLLLARLDWLGQVRRGDLRKVLGMSASAASRAMSGFLRRFGNLVSEVNPRVHVMTRSGNGPTGSGMASGDVLRLMCDQDFAAGLKIGSARWFPEVPVDDLDSLFPVRQDDAVTAAVIAAIASRVVVSVEYVSRSRVSSFAFSPHRLVRFRGNFYVRGLVRRLDGTVEPRTVRLSRMRSATNAAGEEFLPERLDPGMAKESLAFRISDELEDGVRAMLDADMGGEDTFEIVAPRAYRSLILREMTRPRMMGSSEDEEGAYWRLEESSDEGTMVQT